MFHWNNHKVNRAVDVLQAWKTSSESLQSTLLQSLLNSIPNEIGEEIRFFLSSISAEAATEGNKEDLFVASDLFPDIHKYKQV